MLFAVIRYIRIFSDIRHGSWNAARDEILNWIPKEPLGPVVRQGDFQWFSDTDYREQGHIMPLAPSVLRRCFAEQDYALLMEGSVGNPYRQMRSLRKLGRRLVAHALSLFSATPRALRGEVYLGVWRRS